MKINTINVINILMETYSYSSTQDRTPTNANEIELSRHIIDLINNYRYAGYVEIGSDQELVFPNSFAEAMSSSPNSEEQDEVDHLAIADELENICTTESKVEEKEHEDIVDYRKKAVAFWKSGKKRPLSFVTVRARYKKLKALKLLYRWEEQTTKGGRRVNKFEQIMKGTIEKFMEAWDRS